jgi:hypothetical protein
MWTATDTERKVGPPVGPLTIGPSHRKSLLKTLALDTIELRWLKIIVLAL